MVDLRIPIHGRTIRFPSRTPESASRPATNVRVTTPLSVMPSQAQIGLRLSKAVASTTNRSYGRIIAKSARNTGVISPRSSSPTSRVVLHDIHRTTSAKLKPRRIAPVNTARNPTCRLETPPHAVASVPAFISALAGE